MTVESDVGPQEWYTDLWPGESRLAGFARGCWSVFSYFFLTIWFVFLVLLVSVNAHDHGVRWGDWLLDPRLVVLAAAHGSVQDAEVLSVAFLGVGLYLAFLAYVKGAIIARERITLAPTELVIRTLLRTRRIPYFDLVAFGVAGSARAPGARPAILYRSGEGTVTTKLPEGPSYVVPLAEALHRLAPQLAKGHEQALHEYVRNKNHARNESLSRGYRVLAVPLFLFFIFPMFFAIMIAPEAVLFLANDEWLHWPEWAVLVAGTPLALLGIVAGAYFVLAVNRIMKRSSPPADAEDETAKEGR